MHTYMLPASRGLKAPYPTVHPIPQYHQTGGIVHGSPLSLLKGRISHCPSYPTVLSDRWDCPWKFTVPSEDPISHCPIPLYHGTSGTIHGSPLSHLSAPHPTVRPIPQYPGTCGTVCGSPLSLLKGPISHCPSYPTYYQTGTQLWQNEG